MTVGQLQPFERHIALIISAVLLGLGLSVAVHSKKTVRDDSTEIEITVVGAVPKQQIRLVNGSTIDDLISRISMNEDADRFFHEGSRKLRPGEIVVIPFIGKKTVYVIGEVLEEKVVIVENNASSSEILSKIHTTDKADVRSFCRKRAIKNGSVLEIKSQKVRKEPLKHRN